MSFHVRRSAPGNKVLINLDDKSNRLLLRARARSGRTKTAEAALRLRDHLEKYPLFAGLELSESELDEDGL